MEDLLFRHMHALVHTGKWIPLLSLDPEILNSDPTALARG